MRLNRKLYLVLKHRKVALNFVIALTTACIIYAYMMLIPALIMEIQMYFGGPAKTLWITAIGVIVLYAKTYKPVVKLITILIDQIDMNYNQVKRGEELHKVFEECFPKLISDVLEYDFDSSNSYHQHYRICDKKPIYLCLAILPKMLSKKHDIIVWLMYDEGSEYRRHAKVLQHVTRFVPIREIQLYFEKTEEQADILREVYSEYEGEERILQLTTSIIETFQEQNLFATT